MATESHIWSHLVDYNTAQEFTTLILCKYFLYIDSEIVTGILCNKFPFIYKIFLTNKVDIIYNPVGMANGRLTPASLLQCLNVNLNFHLQERME